MHKGARRLLVSLFFAATQFIPNAKLPFEATADAASCCEECSAPCEAGTLVECTVTVPMQVTVTRAKPCVIKETKQRVETYTVFQRVHDERQITKEYCYLENQVRTKEITEEHCHLVKNPVVRTYQVEVPERQIRYKVAQQDGAPSCGSDATTCVESCPCEVIVPRLEERTQCYEEPALVLATTKRQIDYCVQVPRMKKKVCAEERICKLVPVEKTRTVTVCVPRIVYLPVEVTVTKMMPKKILCCKSCCGRHHHH
jgi:hypothetical protein